MLINVLFAVHFDAIYMEGLECAFQNLMIEGNWILNVFECLKLVNLIHMYVEVT